MFWWIIGIILVLWLGWKVLLIAGVLFLAFLILTAIGMEATIFSVVVLALMLFFVMKAK